MKQKVHIKAHKRAGFSVCTLRDAKYALHKFILTYREKFLTVLKQYPYTQPTVLVNIGML